MGGSIELPGSFRPSHEGDVLPDDARVSVTMHLRHPDEEQFPPGSAEDFARLTRKLTTRRKLARERGRQFAPARALLVQFADSYGFKLGMVRPLARTARIEGSAAQFRAAFGASLHRHADGSRQVARSGILHVPEMLAPWVRAVLGFSGKRPRAFSGGGQGGKGLWPNQIARLYGVPADANASGQCIGVVALGGTYQDADLAAAAQQSGMPQPIVVAPANPDQWGADADADRELTLDLQVLAGVAPGATLVVYPVVQSIDHIVDGIHGAINDATNAPHIVSLSWGLPEDAWPADTRSTLDAALRDAVKLGISVVVASGDDLATGAELDRNAHVFHPASSPYVLSCGGTAPTLDAQRSSIVSEEVWNDPPYQRGSGGGISAYYDVPVYQSGLTLPVSLNPPGRIGRGVPDVSAAASADPGYSIVLNGQRVAQPGTSAAAPLWAGILALANAKRTSPLRTANSILYSHPELFRAITQGDNKLGGVGYSAGAPWNACTGLGVPADAGEIIRALASA